MVTAAQFQLPANAAASVKLVTATEKVRVKLDGTAYIGPDSTVLPSSGFVFQGFNLPDIFLMPGDELWGITDHTAPLTVSVLTTSVAAEAVGK